MKNSLLILAFSAGLAVSSAQNVKNEIVLGSNVSIYTTIELKSAAGISTSPRGNKIFTCEKPGIVSCYDSTGTVLWRQNTPAEITTGPLIADGKVTFGNINGEIISLIAETGEQIQSLGIEDSLSTELTAFQYLGDRELFLPKQAESKTAILFGASSGAIHCLDLETLQEYWINNDSHGKIVYPPKVVMNRVLFGSTDGYLYSIDAGSGLLNWRWKETELTDFSGAEIISDGKKVFAVSKDLQLYCIDLLLGKLEWKSEKLKILPSIGLSSDKKNIYAKTDDKRFVIFTASKGTIARQIKMETAFDSLRTDPFDYEGRIYFACGNSLFALDSKFKAERILGLENAGFNIFLPAGSDKFIAASESGTILIFGIK